MKQRKPTTIMSLPYVAKPLDKIPTIGYRIFLAGSIEMGVAVDWQQAVTEAFAGRDVWILNPRRDDWDSSWEQSAHNTQFFTQVAWELKAMELADMILMYFAPGTKSPISLLELGLYARSGKLVVCCPEGFWRKGNVDIVCERYGFRQIDSLDKVTDLVSTNLNDDTGAANPSNLEGLK